jgi:helix-turn-helix protein
LSDKARCNMTSPNQPSGNQSVKVIPFRKRKDLHWFQTYSAFWKRTDLSAEEKGLIHVVLSHLDKDGKCWPTHPQLCAMAKIGHSKLEKMLKKLRKMGEIDWTHFTDEWGHRRCKYVVLSFRKSEIPTPTNQHVATPSKSAGKHITIYPVGAVVTAATPEERLREDSGKYGMQA